MFPIVLEHLDKLDSEARLEAISRLVSRDTDSPEVRGELVQLIDELEDENQRSNAVRSLVQFGPPAGAEIAELLKSADEEFAKEILGSLTEQSEVPKEVLPLVEKYLESQDQAIAIHSAVCLMKSNAGHETAIEILDNALRSNEEEVRQLAMGALYNVPTLNTEFAPALIELLMDRETRPFALQNLGHLETRKEPAVSALIGLLDSVNDFSSAAQALRAIGKAAEPAIPALRTKLESEMTLQTAAWRWPRLKPTTNPQWPC